MIGFLYDLRKKLSSKFSRSELNRRTPENEGETLDVYVSVETIRVIAYVNFFIMVICAVVLNKVLVTPKLAEGDGTTCGPYNGKFGDEMGILPGDGFNVSTGSHLVRLFGYNNICANWDYSPSREITAMIYPIFEYALLIYLFFEGVQAKLYFKKGWVSKTYYRVFKIFFVPMIIGCAWFRMIFVCIAYERPNHHTAGFFCLQITLVMVAIMNTYFMIDSKAEYAWLGGRKGTVTVATTYIVLNLIISPIKLYLTANIVFLAAPAKWSLYSIGGTKAGQVVDNFWFVFNAVIPLLVGFLRSLSEPSLMIKVDCRPSAYSSADGAIIEKTGDVEKEEGAKVIEPAATPEAVASA